MPATIDKLTGFIILAALVFAAVLAAVGPVPQNPAYHNFADQRTLLGIPNFLDVVSSMTYLLAGLAGIAISCKKVIPGGLPELRVPYLLFFTGVMLTGIGSAWYHLEPSNSSLSWDRLPMTVAFMAFFAAIIGEYYSVRAGRRLLWPLIAVGLFSVVYWHISEMAGKGDLRPYIMVQFLPMLLIPLIVYFRPDHLRPTRYLWWLMICYLLAKILELYDREIYTLTSLISGHTLKHLVSATGIVFFYLALKYRHPAGTA